MWQVENGKQAARLEARNYVLSLAASKNGKWIAAGTWREVLVWDAETYGQVLAQWEDNCVSGLHFSPDSTRLVLTCRRNEQLHIGLRHSQAGTDTLPREIRVRSKILAPGRLDRDIN